MNVLYYLLFALWGFLSGSILFCRRIPLWLKKTDICALSKDGNPGTANVFVHCGTPLGLLCCFLDLAKGAVPVLTATLLLGSGHFLYVPVLVAPALGHAVAPFDRFRGGKCIAVIFGCLIGTVTVTWAGWILVGLYIFFAGILRLKPNRLCSLVTFALFAVSAPLILFLNGQFPLGIGYALLAAIAIARHLMIKE